MTSNETTITVALASDSPITIDAAYDAIDRAYPDAEIDVTRASVDATQIDVVTEDMMRDSEIANRVRGILDELWMAAEEDESTTGHRNVLALPYESLTLSERVDAIRAAREAGERFVEDDEEATRDSRARATDYVRAVLEPAYQADQITEAQLNQVERSLSDDPRVAAFIEAADAQYGESDHVRCTGCGDIILADDAVFGDHADTYSGTTWHCAKCAERCEIE